MLTDRQIEQLLAENMTTLTQVARKRVYCQSDVDDVLQATAEILLRNRHRLHHENLDGWLTVVAKHEALALRSRRDRETTNLDLDSIEADASSVPARAAAAMAVDELAELLKPDEVLALTAQGLGYSYREIGERFDWSHTKVNRCVTEGRAAARELAAA